MSTILKLLNLPSKMYLDNQNTCLTSICLHSIFGNELRVTALLYYIYIDIDDELQGTKIDSLKYKHLLKQNYGTYCN